MTNRTQTRIPLVLLCLVLTHGGGKAEEGSPVCDLAAGFHNPSNEARPRAYWNWLNGAVSLPDLTRDLEEAKAKGMGGLEIWDVSAMINPGNRVPAGPAFLSPPSVEAIHHAINEAKRLDLDLGMVTSSGWNAGGPWVTPELASKNLFAAELMVEGPQLLKEKLPFPEVPAACPKGADGLPQWYLDVAVLAWPASDEKTIADPRQVRNLTSFLNDGELTWEVPAGKWQIMRFVCSNNGQRLIVPSPNSSGLFIDFFDPEATRFHFEYIMKALGLKKGGDPGPLKYLEVDSMELHHGMQWTPKFGEWFKQYHHYDPISWLPVLKGWTVKDKPTSERFRYDYLKTVSDLLIHSHYTTGSEVCAEYGLELAGEAGGPGPPVWSSCPVDSLKALGNVDVPRGEFWIGKPGIFLIKEISSAAHIYGKRYVDAESWTTWRRWKDNPFALKRLVDRAFCEGLNRITYHGFAHTPPEAGSPGRSYHAGIDINPQTVWWPKARPFMDYLARTCHMLQQGRFVADVAYFYGDQAPNFWPMVHKVEERILLPGLGAGYDYDVVNSDVILNRMSVEDGHIVLPDGMSYRLLVLPDQPHMPLAVLEKIEALVSAGATIIGPKPADVPGFQDHESRRGKLRALAAKMWVDCDGVTVKRRRYGKGVVVCGMTPREWLAESGIGPDFSSVDPEQAPQLDFIHRRTADEDIYFVRNRSLQAVSTECRFRVTGRAPALWDPVDGSRQPLHIYQSVGETTQLPLHLEPGGSVFIVFAGSQSADALRALTNGAPDATLPVAMVARSAAGPLFIHAWQNAPYVVTDGEGRETQVVVDQLPSARILGGDWRVSFDPNWGAPEEVSFPKLVSWTEHEDPGVEFYSGQGSYTKDLQVPADWLTEGRRVHLDLGEVRDVAEVWVNGKSAGILWKPPYRLEVTSFVKAGENALKIEVRNLWVNRLAGDLKLPEEERFTWTNTQGSDGFAPPAGQGWENPLPAGLLGPVRMLPSVDVMLSQQK